MSGRRLIAIAAATLVVAAAAGLVYLRRWTCSRAQAEARKVIIDLHAIARALDARRQATGGYPAGADLGELARALAPTWLPALPRSDPWGRPFRLAIGGDGYTLLSYGRDGLPDAPGIPVTASGGASRDAVVVDGRFVAWPAIDCR